MSLPVKTGLGVEGGGLVEAGVLTGLAAAAATAAARGGEDGAGVWISGVGGNMAPVCFAKKFRISSFRMRPSFPVPTTSLSLI